MNKKCQIFTPNNIVDLMLDEIGYCNNLSCKKFLENSCGNGNILCNVVERYITEGISQDRAKNIIKSRIRLAPQGENSQNQLRLVQDYPALLLQVRCLRQNHQAMP